MNQVRTEEIALGQMNPGERLLWSGCPTPGAAALGALPATLFGIPFTAFALFWIWGASQGIEKAPGPFKFFPLFGIPFLCVGLGMLLAPLWAWLGARRTVYAVTERRALIITGNGSRTVRSYSGQDIGEITRVEAADGRGTVYFAQRSWTNSRGFERSTRIGFIGIPEVRRVEQLIRDHLQPKAA
ncbi:MAG TPA: hypothetical protein VJY35_06335 [Candidatus Eisenbacteria bacterium]|nr:hypothetical protein [Candidatus Eisenbacteria bacterium]